MLSPSDRQVLTCYAPVRHYSILLCLVRLACVKHAASVHPEPGSNSPWIIFAAAETAGTFSSLCSNTMDSVINPTTTVLRQLR